MHRLLSLQTGIEEEPFTRWTRAVTITLTLMLMLLSWFPKTYIKAAPASSALVINTKASKPVDNSYQYLDDIPGGNNMIPMINEKLRNPARLPREKPNDAGKHHEWDYGAPNNWGKSYEPCDGYRQSPIVIDPTSTIFEPYPKFLFTNYDRIYPMTIYNNGHSVVIQLPTDLPMDSVPTISGGGLTDEYHFAQLHFHWGNTTMGGSEHVIGSYRYPAELHLVHFKAAYQTLGEAIKHGDGLAVLGVFMERETENSHVAFRHFVNLFDQVKTEGPKVSLPTPIYLMDLLPENVDNFYRYLGSLTTPGCQESVIWTVFDSPISISTAQYGKFLTLLEEEGKNMTNNYRPTTGLYDRTVTYRSENTQPLQQPKSQQPPVACSSNQLNSNNLDSNQLRGASTTISSSNIIQPNPITNRPSGNPVPPSVIINKNAPATSNKADSLRFRNGAQGFPLPGRR